jgi:hypothetical protein
MPNIKFSELPLATTVDGNDIFTLVEQPQLVNKIVTYQTLVSQITALTPAQQTSFVRLSGDTMTGYLTLNANPVNNLHAATKQYVDTVAGDLPIGTVMYFAASSAPVGWFECDGRILNTASFPDLFAAIRYTYGGAGVSFNLPDLRGEFLRGWDRSSVQGARGVDSGRVFGSSQADIIKGHTHPIPVDLPLAYGGTGVGPTQRGDIAPGPGVNETLAQTGSGSETRPRNIALLPCIKYSSTAQVSQVGLSAQQLINYITGLSSQIPNSKSVAKAWVTFAGQTATPGISAFYNVTSGTKNSTGNYTFTFTSALSDARYGVFISDNYAGTGAVNRYVISQSTSNFTVQFKDSGVGGNVYDPPFAYIAIFGN